jgi:hypothetical protein
VDQRYDGALAAASLAIDGGTVEISRDGALAVFGKVELAAEGILLVDGMLTAERIDATASDAGMHETGPVIAGSGTITAATVIIGGVLSPGSVQQSGLCGQSAGFPTPQHFDRGAAVGDLPSGTVPEPEAWALLLAAAAVAGVAWPVRRRRALR